MHLRKILTATAAFAIISLNAFAQDSISVADSLATDIAPKTPTRSEIRNNRGLSNLKTQIVPKGQWVFGGSISYSTHTNSAYKLLVVDDIDSRGYSFKVSPLIGYSLIKNSIIGVRFGYTRSFLQLDSAQLNIGEGDAALNFGVDYYYALKHSYDVAAIWRQYIPLGRNKRFAIFAEMQLGMGGSQSKFAEGSPIRGTYSTSFDVSLGVNPGFVAFLTNNMALEVNVGVLGINYSHTKQVHNQIYVGDTRASSMNFKVNILSIGLGVAFYL